MHVVSRDNLISSDAADMLISAHDGDLALLYLYIRRTGDRNLEKAAGALCRTLLQMQEAFEKLGRMGLLDEAGQARTAPKEQKLLPADELPEYTASDVVLRCREDGAFAAVTAEAQRALGQLLSTNDLKKLFGIYDYLGLPPEVIMLLLHHCVDSSRNVDGSARRPTMRYIEREATNWANLEIMTLEQAEEYIDRQKQRREESGKIAELLNIRGRRPSTTEKKYIGSWLEMGFGPETIAIAYDRTLTNTGTLKWPYMNQILVSWKEKGLMSPEEIEEKDSRRREKAARTEPSEAERKRSDREKRRKAIDSI